METTAISSAQTAGEIAGILVACGASQISTDYKDGKITGLRWLMNMRQVPTVYHLPVRAEAVFKVLNDRRSSAWDRKEKADKDRDQAERVAWRQLYRWVQAQAAMIDTGMMEAAEVFLPYADWGGRTLFEALAESGMKTLPAPREAAVAGQ